MTPLSEVLPTKVSKRRASVARLGVVLFLALKTGSVLKASIDTGLLLQLLVFMRKNVLGLRLCNCALPQDLHI